MSVVAHKAEVSSEVAPVAPVVPARSPAPPVPAPRVRPALRRGPVHRPPTRRRVAGAPRVLARSSSCAPRGPRLAAGWLLTVVVVTAAAVVGLGSLAGSVEPSVPSSTTVVRVKPGENLWELAGRVAPGSDASAVVQRIRELNGVEGAVTPGQPLTVPVER